MANGESDTRKRPLGTAFVGLILLAIFAGPAVVLHLPPENPLRVTIMRWLTEKGCQEVDRDNRGHARKGVVCGDPHGVQLRL